MGKTHGFKAIAKGRLQIAGFLPQKKFSRTLAHQQLVECVFGLVRKTVGVSFGKLHGASPKK